MIFVSDQTVNLGNIKLTVSLALPDGSPDTGATLSVCAVTSSGQIVEPSLSNPVTISEVVGAPGVYTILFPGEGAEPFFTYNGTDAPHTVLVKSATVGSTWYRTIAVTVVPGYNTPTKSILSVEAILKNKKSLIKEGVVWSLVVYDTDGTTPILSKVLQDVTGLNITDIAAGVIAQELATSV